MSNVNEIFQDVEFIKTFSVSALSQNVLTPGTNIFFDLSFSRTTDTYILSSSKHIITLYTFQADDVPSACVLSKEYITKLSEQIVHKVMLDQ